MVKRIARGASFVLLGQVGGMAAKGLLILVLTRYLLRPSEYGQLFLAVSILGVAMLFANLGFEKAGARYIAEYRESDPDLVPTAVRTTLRYNAAAIGAVAIGLYLLHDGIATAVGEPGVSGLLLFGIGYVAAKSLNGTAVMLFQGFNRMALVAAVNVVTSVLLIVAVPGFILLGYGLEGAIWGYTTSYAIGAAVGLGVIYTRLYDRKDVDEETEQEVSSRVLRYSLPLTFTMSANVINNRIDTILLGVFRGPVAIAFYTLGKQIADFLTTPARSLGFAVSPSYGEEKAGGDLSRAARLYEQSFTYTMAVYLPAAAGVVLVAKPSIGLLFGAEYVGAGPVLQIFSLFVVVRAVDTITSDALDYLGRARVRAVAKGLSAVANVGLNLVLIPPFGVVGAAVATAGTYSLYVAAELFVVADELPIRPRRLLRSTLLVGGVTVGMSAAVYPVAGSISDVPTLVGVVVGGGVIWLVLTVLTGVVDPRRVYATFR